MKITGTFYFNSKNLMFGLTIFVLPSLNPVACGVFHVDWLYFQNDLQNILIAIALY